MALASCTPCPLSTYISGLPSTDGPIAAIGQKLGNLMILQRRTERVAGIHRAAISLLESTYPEWRAMCMYRRVTGPSADAAVAAAAGQPRG